MVAIMAGSQSIRNAVRKFRKVTRKVAIRIPPDGQRVLPRPIRDHVVQRRLHKAPCGGYPAVAAFAEGERLWTSGAVYQRMRPHRRRWTVPTVYGPLLPGPLEWLGLICGRGALGRH